jgi:glyoxylate utilization-related uncharacterized protein
MRMRNISLQAADLAARLKRFETAIPDRRFLYLRTNDALVVFSLILQSGSDQFQTDCKTSARAGGSASCPAVAKCSEFAFGCLEGHFHVRRGAGQSYSFTSVKYVYLNSGAQALHSAATKIASVVKMFLTKRRYAYQCKTPNDVHVSFF